MVLVEKWRLMVEAGPAEVRVGAVLMVAGGEEEAG